MKQGAAIVIAVIGFLIGMTAGGIGSAVLGAAFLGGIAWLGIVWNPSIKNTAPSQADEAPTTSKPRNQYSSTPPEHQSIEDLYAIFFVSAIADSLELDASSASAKTLRELWDLSPLNEDKMLLNIAIVQVALCTITINFFSDLRQKVNVQRLMDRLAERACDKRGGPVC